MTGPPWIPRAFRTNTYCLCLEPIVRLLPVIFWPILLLGLAAYFAVDKCMHATTCCGRDLRKTRRRKRLDSMNNNTIYDVFDDIELQSTVISTPKSAGEPTPLPPSRSQIRAHSFNVASLSRAVAKSSSKSTQQAGQAARVSSNINPRDMRRTSCQKRVDRAKTAKSLWRRNSESNLSSLQEMPNESVSDMGSHASRANFMESNESFARSAADTVEERRFAANA